jgi:hypothetical protein
MVKSAYYREWDHQHGWKIRMKNLFGSSCRMPVFLNGSIAPVIKTMHMTVSLFQGSTEFSLSIHGSIKVAANISHLK